MAKISPKNTAHAIYATAKGKSGGDLDTTLKNSVEFLANKNLLSKSDQILNELEKIIDDDEGIVRVKVSAQDQLTGNAKEEIENMIKEKHKAKSVILDFREDKSLLGGMRIKTKDELIDITLRNKINQLQNYLLIN